MNGLELLLVSLSVSMDAGAVAICAGITMRPLRLRGMVTVGLYFGLFQALMPLIGYFIGSRFAGAIEVVDHWVVFGLLTVIGVNMIRESRKKDDPETVREFSLSPRRMLPLALATSIDALAVGVSFALVQVRILPAILLLGGITLVVSMAGVKLGNVFGTKFKAWAERAGGAVLIGMGVKIMLEHTGVFPSI